MLESVIQTLKRSTSGCFGQDTIQSSEISIDSAPGSLGASGFAYSKSSPLLSIS